MTADRDATHAATHRRAMSAKGLLRWLAWLRSLRCVFCKLLVCNSALVPNPSLSAIKIPI